MTTRRNLLLGALILFSAVLGRASAAPAAPAHKPAPLEVTYYYLPG
jgi:hypothetical protein